MTSKAQQTLFQLNENQVDEKTYEKFEKDAKRNWDIFYKNNKTNFYKDRHYIKAEFSEMAEHLATLDEGQKLLLLDAGCGVGNGFYPLYREYLGKLLINACDFSPRAVDFVKGNELYDPAFIDAKICDLVNDNIPFEPSKAHYSILLFVLSAISPENFGLVAQKLFRQMAPGGILYFRDYGRYDLA